MMTTRMVQRPPRIDFRLTMQRRMIPVRPVMPRAVVRRPIMPPSRPMIARAVPRRAPQQMRPVYSARWNLTVKRAPAVRVQQMRPVRTNPALVRRAMTPVQVRRPLPQRVAPSRPMVQMNVRVNFTCGGCHNCPKNHGPIVRAPMRPILPVIGPNPIPLWLARQPQVLPPRLIQPVRPVISPLVLIPNRLPALPTMLVKPPSSPGETISRRVTTPPRGNIAIRSPFETAITQRSAPLDKPVIVRPDANATRHPSLVVSLPAPELPQLPGTGPGGLMTKTPARPEITPIVMATPRPALNVQRTARRPSISIEELLQPPALPSGGKIARDPSVIAVEEEEETIEDNHPLVDLLAQAPPLPEPRKPVFGER